MLLTKYMYFKLFWCCAIMMESIDIFNGNQIKYEQSFNSGISVDWFGTFRRVNNGQAHTPGKRKTTQGPSAISPLQSPKFRAKNIGGSSCPSIGARYASAHFRNRNYVPQGAQGPG